MRKIRYFLCGILVAALCFAAVFFMTGFGENAGYTDESAYTDAENLARSKAVAAKAVNAGRLTDGRLSGYMTMKSKTGSITVDFGERVTFNTVILREKGFNVKEFSIFYLDENGEYRLLLRQDKIEDYRYLAFSPVTSSRLKIEIAKAIALPKLVECEVFNVEKASGEFIAAGYLLSNRIPRSIAENSYFDDGIFGVYDRVTIIAGINVSLENGGIDEKKSYGGQDGDLAVTAREIRARTAAIGRRCDIYITIQGIDARLLKSPYRDASIKSIVETAKANDADGIDFNWEFPVGEEEFALFSRYIIDVKAALSAQNLKLSMALYGWGQQMFPAEVWEAVDYVNVMGYDQYDQDGSGGSFLSGVLQPINYFCALGLPRKKIMLGAPFYGTPVDNVGRQIGCGNPVFLRENYFDNFLINKETGELCAFNSPQLIYDKTAYAVHSGLAGIFCWEIGSDVDSANGYSLLGAIARAKKDRLS
ncbi:MAG: glycoside hydrolase family 18 protein [Clostridiales bacterium]|jgi:hypothetical protein|nr:glycoside hydrolase family 18 protein [Clostridiales bacterium]